ILAELRDRVRVVEDACATERQRTGGRVRGRRAVLAQSWRGQPDSPAPRQGLRPTIASRCKWARAEALVRNRIFVQEYLRARDLWREGIAAVFPTGTYWLRRFAHVPVVQT